MINHDSEMEKFVMEGEMYFVISNSDGDTHVECISKPELLKRLSDKDYSSNAIFLDKIPDNTDTNYWGNDILIIKGKVVTPKPKRTVVEYDI